MEADVFYRTITMDETNLLDRIIDVLRREGIDYCIIGGQAVNAYVEQDLADIGRIIEAYPELRDSVPPAIIDMLVR